MPIVRMQGPDNTAGFSHAGENYEADEDGIVEVPSEIVEHAKPHGFELIVARAAQKPLNKIAEGGKAGDKKSPKTEKEEGAESGKAGDGK